MPLQKPKAFSFTANTGDKFTIYGESVEQALMSHLCTCTKVVGHQLTSAEAKNPDVIIMIAPDEFLRYFDSFEDIAETAWDTVHVPKKEECFTYMMNNGERFRKFGTSEKEVLMDHLVAVTEQVGHKLSFAEAENPDCAVMVSPRTLAFVFGSFEKAAEVAWRRAQLG